MYLNEKLRTYCCMKYYYELYRTLIYCILFINIHIVNTNCNYNNYNINDIILKYFHTEKLIINNNIRQL